MTLRVTLWRKEKILVTSIFSFATKLFTQLDTNLILCVILNMQFTSAFDLDWPKILSVGGKVSRFITLIIKAVALCSL